MAERINDEKIGKITNIDYGKRIVWVKDEIGVTYELKWRPKPEVVDDLMRKQKETYRVKITLVKDTNEENPKFWITNCVFDEEFKKRKGVYTPRPEEQKAILLQSCFRTGGIVFAAMIRNQNVLIPADKIDSLFNLFMNTIRERAIADAVTLQAEAKKP